MNGRTVILDVVSRTLYWVILAVAVLVLLRGHNEPGGGFIGGLIAAAASVLWAVAQGSGAALKRLPLGSPVRLAATGVLIAAASGLPALSSGQDFLTHLWAEIAIGPARLAVSTVHVFDTGVFLCVWGAVGGYALALIGADDLQSTDDGGAM